VLVLGDAPGTSSSVRSQGCSWPPALVCGDSTDEADALRSGRSDALLGIWVPAEHARGLPPQLLLGYARFGAHTLLDRRRLDVVKVRLPAGEVFLAVLWRLRPLAPLPT